MHICISKKAKNFDWKALIVAIGLAVKVKMNLFKIVRDSLHLFTIWKSLLHSNL